MILWTCKDAETSKYLDHIKAFVLARCPDVSLDYVLPFTTLIRSIVAYVIDDSTQKGPAESTSSPPVSTHQGGLLQTSSLPPRETTVEHFTESTTIAQEESHGSSSLDQGYGSQDLDNTFDTFADGDKGFEGGAVPQDFGVSAEAVDIYPTDGQYRCSEGAMKRYTDKTDSAAATSSALASSMDSPLISPNPTDCQNPQDLIVSAQQGQAESFQSNSSLVHRETRLSVLMGNERCMRCQQDEIMECEYEAGKVKFTKAKSCARCRAKKLSCRLPGEPIKTRKSRSASVI